MTTSIESLINLSGQELLDHFASLVARDRRTTAELLVAIAEIDERKLWAAHACSSMFTFCIERFHMSEQVTGKRIWAARTARRFPIVLDMVARGELHLSAIHLLAKHLTEENHARVLERAQHKSCRDVERLIAEIAPQGDAPSRIRALPGARGGRAASRPVPAGLEDSALGEPGSRSFAGRTGNGPAAAAFVQALSHELSANADPTDAGNQAPANGNPTSRVDTLRVPGTPDSRTVAKPIVPLSPRRYKIEITVNEATHDKLRSLQDLLARSGTGRDPAAIISRAIDELLVRTLTRKAACTDRPRPSKPASSLTAATPMTSRMLAESLSTTSPVTPARIDPSEPTPASDVAAASRGKRSRTIPAAVRREVWQRDSGRCCYLDAHGRRCRETSHVEFHHESPFALGGLSTTDNIELRCAAHNQFQADLDFGRSFMDSRRSKVAAATTLRGMPA